MRSERIELAVLGSLGIAQVRGVGELTLRRHAVLERLPDVHVTLFFLLLLAMTSALLVLPTDRIDALRRHESAWVMKLRESDLPGRIDDTLHERHGRSVVPVRDSRLRVQPFGKGLQDPGDGVHRLVPRSERPDVFPTQQLDVFPTLADAPLHRDALRLQLVALHGQAAGLVPLNAVDLPPRQRHLGLLRALALAGTGVQGLWTPGGRPPLRQLPAAGVHQQHRHTAGDVLGHRVDKIHELGAVGADGNDGHVGKRLDELVLEVVHDLVVDAVCAVKALEHQQGVRTRADVGVGPIGRVVPVPPRHRHLEFVAYLPPAARRAFETIRIGTRAVALHVELEGPGKDQNPEWEVVPGELGPHLGRRLEEGLRQAACVRAEDDRPGLDRQR
mmetsp:Transcript_119740/g.344057  ORF Transcript_119740/g.344057 Transcript_119740/m.344057 type:complete len:388 (-) Transcript_119740:744-1907(-)